MNSHIILMAGPAGSGKDTVAAIIAGHFGGTCIAQADPMKRFAQNAFEFTQDQLWGPSESRNAVDPRLDKESTWLAAGEYVHSDGCRSWLRTLLKQGRSEVALDEAHAAMKEWFYDVFGKLNTPRAILQTFGTEYGRHLHEDLWSNVAMATARRILLGGVTYDRSVGIILKPDATSNLVVITDGRFRNEILNVQSQGGYTIRVVNPAPSDYQAKTAAAGIKGHASEAELSGIPDHFFNLVLTNDKEMGLQFAENMVRGSIERLFTPVRVG